MPRSSFVASTRCCGRCGNAYDGVAAHGPGYCGAAYVPTPQDKELAATAEQLSALRKQRDQLIRDHDGTLREIGAAAGLSAQQVLNIKNRKEGK